MVKIIQNYKTKQNSFVEWPPEGGTICRFILFSYVPTGSAYPQQALSLLLKKISHDVVTWAPCRDYKLCRMRRYIRALLLCTVFAVFSGFYVYSKLLLSEVPVGGNGPKTASLTPRVPGGRRGVVDKTRSQVPHWYNRWVHFRVVDAISRKRLF